MALAASGCPISMGLRIGSFLERGRASVPELTLHQCRVHGGGRAAFAQMIAYSLGHAAMIGESAADIVACRTGERAVLRQAGIEVQLAAQRDAVRRHFVAAHHIDARPGHWIDAGRRGGIARDQFVKPLLLRGYRHRAVRSGCRIRCKAETGAGGANEID